MMLAFKRQSRAASPIYDALRPDAADILYGIVSTAVEADAELCLVAAVEGLACGFLLGGEVAYAPYYAIERFGHVSDLYVRDTHRGRGVGSALLAAAESHFKDRGLQHMRLESIVHYPHNVAFYERRGFGLFIREFRKAI